MRAAVSVGAPVLASQVGKSVSVLPLSGEYPQGDLHNQRDRISASPVQKADQN